jgi:transcriptional regulator of acetoin/glycerol metabolism
MNYAWPGNVRELRTAIEHAVVLTRGEKIGLRDLPPALRAAAPGGGPARLLGQPDLTVAQAEKHLILRALKECAGNRTEAARKLGMSRRTLHRKLHLYQLEGV